MIKVIVILVIFAMLFTAAKTLLNIKDNGNSAISAQTYVKAAKNTRTVRAFVTKKQVEISKKGADIFIKDGITVSDWYTYKLISAAIGFVIGSFVGKAMIKTDLYILIGLGVALASFFVLDLIIRVLNKSSNDAMMSDILEMSRSVLYGKRGGQFIGDAIKDAVMVVENKRLKTALIKMNNNLDSGKSLDESLDEFEVSFSNGEISAFCTVIKALQSTGQVDESLKTLETNIEREEVSVNKKRCVVLENKTMFYVMIVAFDILAVILYCVIMKLLEMQIAF